MRITNSMMNNNTKNNININKLNEDRINTMIASGQKITRPSDDPIIAIRALRLNSNISEVNQYYDKNIPDADAWLEITGTALDQTNEVLTEIKKSLTTGASDDNEAEDRMNILKDLTALRDQIYSAGNADYAGRTVFTGYRTGETLTFTEDTTNLHTITELFNADDVECITYISGGINVNKGDLANANTEQDIKSNNVYRIRLAYDNLTNPQVDQDGTALPKTIAIDGTPMPAYTVNTVSLTGDPAIDDAYYTTIGEDEVRLIADTGELLLGENVRKAIQGTTGTVSFEYAKEDFAKNDLRPEHYFTCTDKDEVEYNSPSFENKSISYEISFNQSIKINTNANEVFTHDIGRDVDELLAATQAVVDCDEKITTLEEMQSDSQYSDAEQEKITEMLAAATKERDLLKDKMQKMFSGALTSFDGYSKDTNLALAGVGSMQARLELTKERVKEQLSSFKELADSNININLTDAGIELKAASLALEAAQLAASKIAQQTLLNYL
ncbi:MAG: flagellar hook-associated protein 3 [Lachnospiraceae bacterium]